jgi:hypothetical protein
MTRLANLIVAVLIFLLGSFPALAQSTPGHIRVVLDVSQSMQGRDPSRLALMSTALLRDLLRPDPLRRDSFAVVPFDAAPGWMWEPGGRMPGCGVNLLRSNAPADRDAFASALAAMPYAGHHTWYSPCLKRALVDLPAATGQQRRVVVLLTDGLPADELTFTDADRASVLAAEKAEMRRVVTEARANGAVDFYILAVGPAATAGAAWLEEVAGQDAGGARVGTVLKVPAVDDLPRAMISIYERSFGYGAELANADGERFVADLAAGEAPDDVALVAIGRGSPAHEPRVAATPPLAHHRWGPDPAWGGYGISWLPRPSGRAVIEAPGAQGVVVLRPRRWVIVPTGTMLREVIAERSTVFEFVVQPAGSSEPVRNVSLRAFLTSPDGTGNSLAPTSNAGTPVGDGTQFGFRVQWPARGTSIYEGSIRVEAMPADLGGAVLASTEVGVTVHPPLTLSLLSASGLPSLRLGQGGGAIADGESAEARIVLRGVETLPETLRSIPLQFVLEAPVAAGAGVPGGASPGEAISASTFRIMSAGNASRAPVAYATGSGPGLAGQAAEPRDWQDSVPMTRDELAEEMTISVDARSDAVGGTVRVPLHAILAAPPYSNYPDLIAPLAVELTLAQPSWIARAIPWLVALLLGLWALATLWYGRERPAMPPDFRVGVWQPGAPPDRRPLYPSSPVRALLGLSPRHTIPLGPNGRSAGTLEPVAQDLYRLRLASDVSVTTEEGPEPAFDGRARLLAAGATYLLTTPSGPYRISLGYRSAA